MDDPYLWLEEVEGGRALDWAREQNARALKVLQAHPLFERLHRRHLEILTAGDRVPYPEFGGGRVFNFWRDGAHERGLWRRASVDSYRTGTPDWETLIDLDELARAEETNWVWAGAQCRYPDYDRALLRLSIGGADAAVYREFDLGRRTLVDDGFRLPESKSRMAWRDRDSVFLGPALSDDQVTDSGYPRQVLIWRRGTPIDDATLVFDGERSDVSVAAVRIWDRTRWYDVVLRAPDFFRREYHLYRDGRCERLDVPDDAELVGIVSGQVLLTLKSDWRVGGRKLPQGALVAAALESLLARSAEFDVLHAPDERGAIAGVGSTEGTVLVSTLDNVAGRLFRFAHDGGGWRRDELALPRLGTVAIVSTDDVSDHAFVSFAGFLTPTTLYLVDPQSTEPEPVQSEPAWFDASGMSVTQHEAISADGTRVPYFVVTPRGFVPTGTSPSLLSAYGGFQVPRTPLYSGVLGASWLEHGGVYVLANIRGGGEFGPRWHQAALKENRQRAYDDFIAVAEDLVTRGITSSRHLDIQGGSNGGLLVAAAFTQRPDLFNAVVCQVPLLDMRRYHRLLAGASWMAEYGNPDEPEQWAYIARYSPYQNVSTEAHYPQVFFTTSTRDDRVHPGHARKMVAKMQALGYDVLYYENIEGGHGGAANLPQTAFIQALIFTYLHQRLDPDTQGKI
jgi:prolyl oligopeptidase